MNSVRLMLCSSLTHNSLFTNIDLISVIYLFVAGGNLIHYSILVLLLLLLFFEGGGAERLTILIHELQSGLNFLQLVCLSLKCDCTYPMILDN